MPPSLKRFAITLVGIALGYAAIKALSDLLWRTWGAELAAARTGGASFMVPCLVVLVVVAVRWTESRPRWRGAPGGWRAPATIGVLVAVLAGIGWLYRGVLADIVANGVHAPSITIALVTAVVIGPVVEEWLFRDLLWRAWAPPGRVAFVRGLGAVVATSLAFAAWHLPFNADAPLLAHALYGGMLAALRWRAGAILPGVVIHAATNALYFVA